METVKTCNEPLEMQNQQPHVSPACATGECYQSKVYHNYPWFRLAAWITVFFALAVLLSPIILPTFVDDVATAYTTTYYVGMIHYALWCIVFIGLFRFIRENWKIKSHLGLLIGSSATLFAALIGLVVCDSVAPEFIADNQTLLLIVFGVLGLIHWAFLINTGIRLTLKKVTKSLGVHFLIYAGALLVMPSLCMGLIWLTLKIEPTADVFIIEYVSAAIEWIITLLLFKKICNTME